MRVAETAFVRGYGGWPLMDADQAARRMNLFI
jgi:hypothetical protein